MLQATGFDFFSGPGSSIKPEPAAPGQSKREEPAALAPTVPKSFFATRLRAAISGLLQRKPDGKGKAELCPLGQLVRHGDHSARLGGQELSVRSLQVV